MAKENFQLAKKYGKNRANEATSSIGLETAVAKKVWEAADDETYRQDQSHWRGVGRWANDRKWLNIGQSSLKKINKVARAIGAGPEIWVAQRTVLEWGPGGGSNALALSRFAQKIYGVDISEKNLNECKRMLDQEGYTSFHSILIGEDPRETLAQVDEPLDVFGSFAVFQHFPSKAYGEAVLKVLREMCSRGAFGVIQIRYDDGRDRYRPITNLSEYEKKHITANSYAISEFYKLCEECGFEVVMVFDIIDRFNYASFGLRAR